MLRSPVRQLHELIAQVCPIDGVSVPTKLDKTTWRIDFKLEATSAQQTAARAVVAAFDPFAPVPPDPLEAAIDARLAQAVPPLDPGIKLILQEWRKLV